MLPILFFRVFRFLTLDILIRRNKSREKELLKIDVKFLGRFIGRFQRRNSSVCVARINLIYDLFSIFLTIISWGFSRKTSPFYPALVIYCVSTFFSVQKQNKIILVICTNFACTVNLETCQNETSSNSRPLADTDNTWRSLKAS